MQTAALLARLMERVSVLEKAAGIVPPPPAPHPGASVATLHRAPVFQAPPEPARTRPVALVEPKNPERKPKG